MTTTSLTSDLASLPQFETQSSSNSVEKGICLPFNEAIKTLPVFLQSNDEHKQHELSMFLSQVDKLYKSDSLHTGGTLILNYIRRILEATPKTKEMASQGTLMRSEAFDSLPKLPFKLQNITEDIATEIAGKVIRNVDSHNITIAVLYILQQYSWETKVALMVTTYILTFGDFGLNLCAESKVNLNNISMFVKQLLEMTSCIVEFEKLPKAYMTSADPNIKDARTHFVVAIYWIIRAVMVNYASHIMTISSRGYKFGTTISPPSDEKLDPISSHLKTKLLLLQELLVKSLDFEAYNKIKEIVQQEDHNDNLEVLNALFSSNDDAPELYDCSTKEKVHLNKLEGKFVLLFITEVKNDNHMRYVAVIHGIHDKLKKKYNTEFLFIPILDHYSLQPPSDDVHGKLKSWDLNLYMINEQMMIKNEVIKFFKDDWNFTGEPIIVALDPQGNVVNQDALPIIFSWFEDAFPFTYTKEVEMLVALGLLSQHSLVKYLSPFLDYEVGEEMYIFMYGGINLEWIQNFTKMVDTVVHALSIPLHRVKKLYVGKSNNEYLGKWVCSFIQRENLSHCFANFIKTWLFWRRIESIIHIMTKHGVVSNIFHEIQRLYNYETSNTEWVILIKGSKTLVVGNGNIVLSTLKDHELWKEKASTEGFGEAFKSHYQELYRRNFLVHRLEFPTTALTDLNICSMTMNCTDCNSKMKKWISFTCGHPPWDSEQIYD